MPTYDYQCKNCGAEKEVFHEIAEKPNIKCDKCGGDCEKIISVNSKFLILGTNNKESAYSRMEI